LLFASITALPCPDTAHNTFHISQTGNVLNVFGLRSPLLTVKSGCTYLMAFDGTVTDLFIRQPPGVNNLQGGSASFNLSGLAVGNYIYTSQPGAATVFGSLVVINNSPSCSQYCSDFLIACQSQSVIGYASQQECEAVCSYFQSDSMYGTPSGLSQYPDSFECRNDQAINASTSVPNQFGSTCESADALGGYIPNMQSGFCNANTISWCDLYCVLTTSVCSGNNALFADIGTCNNYCQIYNTGGASIATNSFECRQAAAQAATLDPTQCIAASLLGFSTGVSGCGTSACQNYCDARTFATCSVTNCMADCASVPKNGALIGFSTGNTLECFNANAFEAIVSGLTYCNTDMLCPIISSSAFLSSSVAPSSSKFPSSSSPPTGATGATGTGTGATGTTGAVSSSADHGSAVTTAVEFVGLVLLVLAL